MQRSSFYACYHCQRQLDAFRENRPVGVGGRGRADYVGGSLGGMMPPARSRHGGLAMMALRQFLLPLALLLGVLLPAASFAAGLAQNENFIVLTPAKPSQKEGAKYAALVLKNAAEFRAEFCREWLGAELADGEGKTIISVHFSEAESTGLTWARDDASRRFHNVYLTTSAERASGTMLRHEVAHTVLATRYPHPNRLPPWAEEGIASRYDDRASIAVREQTVQGWLRAGRMPLVIELLETPHIEAFDDNGYAAAESLVEYLLTLVDKPTLLAFAEDGKRFGWHSALANHYGIDGVGTLQSEWQAWMASSMQ
jgi:hypothetical protein